MNQKPVLFLDIDGVVNILSREVAPEWCTDVAKDSTGRPWPMTWDTRVIEALSQLDVELIWLTTWREAAVNVGYVMGWGYDAPFLPWEWRYLDYSSIQGKNVALMEWLEENPGRKVIHIDDEYAYGDFPLLREVEESSGVLVIGPNPSKGLTLEEIERIHQYLSS